MRYISRVYDNICTYRLEKNYISELECVCVYICDVYNMVTREIQRTLIVFIVNGKYIF